MTKQPGNYKSRSVFRKNRPVLELDMDQPPTPFWSIPSAEMLQRMESTADGLTSQEAQRRLALYGSNLLKPKKRSDTFTLLLSQFKSPIILILLFATGLSFFLHDHVNAVIILVIVMGSGLLGFWQENGERQMRWRNCSRSCK